MRWLAGIAFALMHAACSSSASMPDAMTVDASTGGLTIELVAKGGVPQMPAPTVELEKVVLGIKLLRAIGDAAPGDMRTTRTAADLAPFEWSNNLMPIPHLFPLAPPGVYSSIELQVGETPRCPAIEIGGRVVRGGNLVPFEVRSMTTDLPIAVAVTTELPPRTIATATIEVDVAALIEDVDWDSVPLTGEGRLSIGDGDPEMPGVIANLATAFKAAN